MRTPIAARPGRRLPRGARRGLGVALAAVVALLLLLASGCGLDSDSSDDTERTDEPTTEASGGSADEEVQAAVAELLDDSFRFSASYGTEIEAVEASPAVDAFVDQSSGSIDFEGEYESAGRFVVEAESGVMLTFYDGEVYGAASGGSAEVLDSEDRERQSLADLPALIEASTEAGTFEDAGVEQLDGEDVRHYSGTSDGTALRDAYARANSFAQVPPPDDVLSIEDARVDVYVDEASGDLVRQTEETTLVLDFGGLGLGADGVARLVLTQERDFSDQGDPFVVVRP